MSVAPNDSMKLIYLQSDDMSGALMYPKETLQGAGFGGAIVRIGGGRQLHDTGQVFLGHVKPNRFNDYSLKNHVQLCYDLGWLCLLQFDFFGGSDFQMAGDDFETQDDQFVPFSYQLNGLKPGVSYHGFVVNVNPENETAGNVAAKLGTFIVQIRKWMEKCFPEQASGFPIYLRTSKAIWELGNREIENLMANNGHMPYVLDGVTQTYSKPNWDVIPEPFETNVWEPGTLANYKWERACLWHYGDLFIQGEKVELLVAWGPAAHVFEVIGYTPVNYGSGSGNPGGGVTDPPVTGDLKTVLEKLTALEAFQELANAELSAIRTIQNEMSIDVLTMGTTVKNVWSWVTKSFLARFGGYKE